MSSTILGQRNHLIPKNYIPCLCFIAHLRLTPCNPMDCSLPGSSVHRDSPGKNTGVGCHALFQGIFPTQGSNLGLPHCRQILYCLSHQGSIFMLLPPTQMFLDFCCCPVTMLYPAVCDCMDCSVPGLPVLHLGYM